MLQTRHQADSQNRRTNRDPQAKLDEDSMGADKTNIPDYLNSSTSKFNMPDYFNSCASKEADKNESKGITKRICNEFKDLLSV